MTETLIKLVLNFFFSVLLIGTPQASYSGTIQQLNPLSPPDVLPQPILPSPIKPDVQSSLQDVTIETPIPNQEMHPRARESPVVNRKQVI